MSAIVLGVAEADALGASPEGACVRAFVAHAAEATRSVERTTSSDGMNLRLRRAWGKVHLPLEAAIVSRARLPASRATGAHTRPTGSRRTRRPASVVLLRFAGTDPEGADPGLQGGGLEREELRGPAAAVDAPLRAPHRGEDVVALPPPPLPFGNDFVGGARLARRSLDVHSERRGDELEVSVAARDHLRMGPRRLEQLEGPAGGQTVAAHRLDGRAPDRIVELPLVLGEAGPFDLREPGCAPGSAYAFEAVGTRLLEQRLPAMGHRLGVERSLLKVELVVPPNVETAALEVTIEIGDR